MRILDEFAFARSRFRVRINSVYSFLHHNRLNLNVVKHAHLQAFFNLYKICLIQIFHCVRQTEGLISLQEIFM